MQITYPVPAETTTAFVVAIQRTPFDLRSIVPWRMEKPHRRSAAAVLDTPRLRLTAYRTAQSPWRRIDLGDDDDRDRVRKARHHVVVSCTAPVAAQPEAAQVARAAARGIAEAYDGVIADEATGAVVYHCAGCPGEREGFRLGDDWLGWSTDVVDDSSCPPYGASGELCACLRVTTRGLRRFGLPEVMLNGAACAHTLCSVTVLRTVAQRLLDGHLAWAAENPDARTRTIGEHLRIDGKDFAVVSGAPDLEREPFHVRLTPHGADMTCLRVTPPETFEGSVNDWLCRTRGLLAS